jgi:glycosidase
MPWSDGQGAGFTNGKPWLRLGSDWKERNVASQRGDPDSVLSCYRRLLAARSEQPSLQDGTLDLVDLGDPSVLAYRRLGSGAEVLVMIAFSRDGATVRPPSPRHGQAWRPIAGTRPNVPSHLASSDPHRLLAFEGLVLVAEP